MKTLGRSDSRDRPPASMTFDGTNGAEIAEWCRDDDLMARFQYRPEIPGEPARVLLTDPLHWAVVPKGGVISIARDGTLSLKVPEDTEENA